MMITELSKLPEEVWRGRDMVPALMATNAAEHFSSPLSNSQGFLLLFDRLIGAPDGLFLSIGKVFKLHFLPTKDLIDPSIISSQLPLQTGTVTGALPAKRN